jgi:hypothetical protein
VRTIAVLCLCALCALPFAFADDNPKPPDSPPDGTPPPDGAKPPEPKDPKVEPKKEEVAKPDPASPFQRVLKELTALIAREKTKPQYDKALVADLEEIVKTYAKMGEKPLKLEDLSEADRKKLEDEVRKKLEAERPLPPVPGGDPAGAPPGGGPGDWLQKEKERRIERITEGVDLSDEQRDKVKDMLSQYIDDSLVAWQNQDYGAINDIKSELEKQLKPVVGAKKAKDIINNVNRETPGWRGGRGGR